MNATTDTPLPLRIEHLIKRFKQGAATIEALSEVSLEVTPGEFVAVMGASGSGKSTLLHVAAGLTAPDEGSVFVDGEDLAAMSDRRLTVFRRRRIGVMFQAFNLIPSLTAEQNIMLPVRTDGRGAESRERLEMLLDRLRLAGRRTHRPDALSGGEQQRVAFARALIADPAIVLADEPTGSLDSVTGQELCRLLQDLCREQHRTIVVVTHEPAVATWADRIVVLADGRVLTDFRSAEFGDAQSLAAHYHDIVQAALPVEASR
ncbi:MAG: ABC transporter ATP-binding protein [Planctomycetaceae bacterium]|nr:ABC transporter ATP-binding protein [Planctomycetaceae bacterium]